MRQARPLIELCAGLAGLTLWTRGQQPPISRIGSKSGYAAALAGLFGWGQTPRPGLLVDSDPRIVNALQQMFSQPQTLAAAVSELGKGEARPVWEQARRAALPTFGLESAAAWWLWSAGARGGIGGFKGAHVLRPNVDGFIPSRESLVARIQGFPVCMDIEVRLADARTVEPFADADVYIDPPYDGAQGYGKCTLSTEDVITVAKAWAAAGSRVIVSERAELDLPWVRKTLTNQRTGQCRKSLSTDNTEYAYVSWL